VHESDLASDKIVAACNAVADELIQQEIRFFSDFGDQGLADWYGTLQQQRQAFASNECLLHIAWGSGFDPKTLDDLLDERTFDDIRWAFNLGKFVQDEQGKRKMVKPFPKSRKVVLNGQRSVPMGWVKLIIL
jgi:CRISPR type III-A-associated RAMP protein Csm5